MTTFPPAIIQLNQNNTFTATQTFTTNILNGGGSNYDYQAIEIISNNGTYTNYLGVTNTGIFVLNTATTNILAVDTSGNVTSGGNITAGGILQASSYVYVPNSYVKALGLQLRYNNQSANYTATANDYLINATGGSSGITITLPSSTGSGQIIIIKKIDSGAGAITITPNGTNVIDNATSVSLATQFYSITLMDVTSSSFTATYGWTVLAEIGITSPV